MFSFWVCSFYLYFFGIFIYYIWIYILHSCLNILIFLCLIWMKSKERIELSDTSDMVVCTCSMCEWMFVCMRVSFCVNTITCSFSCLRCWSQTRREQLRFWGDSVVSVGPWFPWDRRTDGQTAKPLRTTMVWLGFRHLKPHGNTWHISSLCWCLVYNIWKYLDALLDVNRFSKAELNAFDKNTIVRLCIQCTFMCVHKWEEYAWIDGTHDFSLLWKDFLPYTLVITSSGHLQSSGQTLFLTVKMSNSDPPHVLPWAYVQ